MNYKPLEPTFQKNGFRFRQLVREGDLAIFHKVHLNPAHDSGFEVVEIGRHDGYEMAGVQIPPAETYPGNEKWGVKGFTYTDLFSAELRFERMKNGDVVASAQLGDPMPEGEEEAAPEEPEAPKAIVYNGPALNVPEGEFSIKEVAELNNVHPVQARLFILDGVNKGTFKPTRTERRALRGRATQLFQKTA